MKQATAGIATLLTEYDSTAPRWPDAEGGSFICTLGKAWGDDAPAALDDLLTMLVDRSHHLGRQNAATSESAALGVAHLLPTALR